MPLEPQPQYRFQLDPGDPRAALVIDLGSRRVVDANRAACELYGYPRDELIGMSLERLRPPEEVEELHRRLALSAQERVGRARHRDSSGRVFDVALESQDLQTEERKLQAVFVRDISQSAEAHRAAFRQALLFRTMSEAVIFTDEEGRITDWNPAAERLWQWPRDQVLGRTAEFLHPGDEGLEVVSTIIHTLHTSDVWEGTLETVSREGEPRVCQTRVVAVRNDAGELRGTIGINRDITEQRRVEQALAERSEDLRILGSQIPHILWATGPDGLTSYLNERWVSYTGQKASQAAEAGWIAQVHPEDREATVAAWTRSVESGDDFVVEHRIRRADGHYRWHLSRGSAVRTPEGEIIRWVGSSMDIQDQKTAESRARRREAYFRGVFEHAHDAIVLYDRSTGRVVDANPKAEELYGYDRAELLKLAITDIHADQAALGRHLARIVAEGHGTEQLQQCTRSGDRILVEVNVTTMDLEDRSVLLTVNRDLTDRRELEAQFRQAQKMEAIGRLTGGLAHDFNNLTTAITGFASLLEDHLDAGTEPGEALAEIQRAAERATDLTRQLLAYSRQQVMRNRVLDLNEVVRASQQLLGRLIGADIEVEVELEEELGSVRADPGQVQQILMNLAVNARDAMPEGGRLRLKTRNVGVDRAFADGHPPMEPGRYVHLRVEDTGLGMDEATRDRAFDPFFTTKAVGEGTGLGLATVYGIVKQSGGFVWIRSEPGQGTAFDIYLPAIQGQGAPPERPKGADQPPEAVNQSATILLVEDEEGVRKLALRILERAGYEVIVAEDGQEALDLASGDRPIDLVLTDMVMPQVGGRELARELAVTRPGTPVLFMSGYTGASLVERGDLDRNDVIIEKPFRPAELVDVVSRTLRSAE